MNRNERRRAVARKRALPAFLGPVAIGNDLAAQNDEPEDGEPITFQQGGATQEERNLAALWTGLSEQDLELVDVELDRGKAQRKALRDYNAVVASEGGSERLLPFGSV
jgi:hypothetical protein